MGFALYLPTVAVAPEALPVIVSPVLNLDCADMNNFLFDMFVLSIVA